MKKRIATRVNDVETELNIRYALAGPHPEGFEDSMYSIKLGILAEMYDADEAAGKLTPERDTAYGKVAEQLENMDCWR